MKNRYYVAAALTALILLACGGGGGGGSSSSGAPSGGAVVAPAPAPILTPTITLTRSGSGNVVSAPAGINCGSTCTYTLPSNGALTLTATPASGYAFGGWTGGGCSGTATCTVNVTAPTTVWANFTPVVNVATQYVPLNLLAGPAATGVALRTGIPFPIGAVANVAHLRLETGSGSAEVPAQFDVLARWPDNSIKVALVHLVADMGPAASYRVAYGTSVSRAALSHSIAVIGTGSTEINVDTGLIQFTVNNKGLVHKVWRDANGDRLFTAGEQLIDQAEVFVTNAKDNQDYLASTATDTVVTIEENGPMRVVIKAKGSLTNGSGVKLAKYQIRYYASAGSDKLDVETTLIDDRIDSMNGSGVPYAEDGVTPLNSTLAFAAKSFGMRWRYVPDGTPGYRFGGEGGLAYGGTVSGEHYLLQTGQYNYMNEMSGANLIGIDRGHDFNYSGVGTGNFAPGWVNVGAGSKHITLLYKDFWQQYPGELNINSSGNYLSASFFAARSISGAAQLSAPSQVALTRYQRANTLYFTRPGGAKTYQLRLAFAATSPSTGDLNNLNSSYQRHKLELMSTPAWYTASGVFGDLNEGGSTSASTGYSAHMMKDIFERSIDMATPTFGDGSRGLATAFGWRDFGDRIRAGWTTDSSSGSYRIPTFYNDTHVGANGYFKEFLRTGDQRWHELADISTRHFMDIDVVHGPRRGYRVSGGLTQPPGEIHAVSHENIDHQVKALHYGHAHVSGMSDMYLLTGDKRAYEVLAMVADWWKFMAPYSFELKPVCGGFVFDNDSTPTVGEGTVQCNGIYREAERDFGWPLYVMNEWVRVSADHNYHRDAAAHLAEYMIQWWKTPRPHVGYDPATNTISASPNGTNDATAGTGWWSMTRMDNSAGYLTANGVNPWMAGALIGNLIKFREQEELFVANGHTRTVNRTDMVNMLMQTTNYVVKNGYDTTNKWFVYSEMMRTYDGGNSHIVYPLAYLDRLYKQEVAAGRPPLLADTTLQLEWIKIATTEYNRLRTLALGSSQSYGFYGYELVYPPDFFKVMADTLGY